MPTSRRRAQRLGQPLGPLLGLAVALLLPAGSEPALRATALLATWMAVWWLSEAIPIYATALLPLVMLPLLGAANPRDAAAPYAHPLIFLFLGGFLIATSMQRWGLHRRIALQALRLVGNRPHHIVGGFMVVTAGLSMWVSNTATAVMMLPVALSVIGLVAEGGTSDGPSPAAGEATSEGAQVAGGPREFALALLLGIAYAASIGGIATPIGTPPNLFLLSYLRDSLGIEISFARWMGVGLPLVLVFLPAAWWLLTHVLHPPGNLPIRGSRRLFGRALAELGPMRTGERATLAVFVAAALLWMTRPWLEQLSVGGHTPLAGLDDAGIAIGGALLLFLAPVDRKAAVYALDWEHALRVPWGVLLLFGGGLSLAAAIDRNGLGELLAAGFTRFEGLPSPLLVVIVVAGVVFLTELTSNTATTATLVPLLAAVAPGLGLDPLLLAVPAALAASCAFMLPVATPPNAVIFGSGHLSIAVMSRAGLWLNLIAIVLVTGLTYAVAMPLLAGR